MPKRILSRLDVNLLLFIITVRSRLKSRKHLQRISSRNTRTTISHSLALDNRKTTPTMRRLGTETHLALYRDKTLLGRLRKHPERPAPIIRQGLRMWDMKLLYERPSEIELQMFPNNLDCQLALLLEVGPLHPLRTNLWMTDATTRYTTMEKILQLEVVSHTSPPCRHQVEQACRTVRILIEQRTLVTLLQDLLSIHMKQVDSMQPLVVLQIGHVERAERRLDVSNLQEDLPVIANVHRQRDLLLHHWHRLPLLDLQDVLSHRLHGLRVRLWVQPRVLLQVLPQAHR